MDPNLNSLFPLWADELRTNNTIISDPDNFSTTIQGTLTPYNFSMVNTSAGTYMNLSSSLINFSDNYYNINISTTGLTANNNYKLSVNGDFDINASKVLLNGIAAPSTPGQSLIANNASGGLQWFTISDLLNLEAGIFVNENNTSAYIQFNKQYGTAPAVVITPDCGVNGRIIPVTLAGVTTNGFNVLFGSNKLTKFNFVVLPINSTYAYNVSFDGPYGDFYTSSLNASGVDICGNIVNSTTSNVSGIAVDI